MKKIILFFALLFCFVNAFAWTIDGDSVYIENSSAKVIVTPHTATSPVNKFEQTFELQYKKDFDANNIRAVYYFSDKPNGVIEKWMKPVYGWIQHQKDFNVEFYDWNYVDLGASERNRYDVTVTTDVNGYEETVWRHLIKDSSFCVASPIRCFFWDDNVLKSGNNWKNYNDAFHSLGQVEVDGKTVWYYYSDEFNLSPQQWIRWRLNYSTAIPTGKWVLAFIQGNADCLVDGTDACTAKWVLDPWWNSNWDYKRAVQLPNQDMNAGDTIQITDIDFSSYGSKVKADLTDVRIVDENKNVELDRVCDGTSSSTDANCFFFLDHNIAQTSTEDNTTYYMYYGNNAAAAPPDDNVTRALSCGFESGRTCGFPTASDMLDFNSDTPKFGFYSLGGDTQAFPYAESLRYDAIANWTGSSSNNDINYSFWFRIHADLSGTPNATTHIQFVSDEASPKGLCAMGMFEDLNADTDGRKLRTYGGGNTFGVAGGGDVNCNKTRQGVTLSNDTWYRAELRYKNKEDYCRYTWWDSSDNFVDTMICETSFAGNDVNRMDLYGNYGDDIGYYGFYDNVSYGLPFVATLAGEETANISPDANIWKVDGYDLNAVLPSFSYSSDKNLTMIFRTSDADSDDLNFNMWYDTSANGKTNKIIGDINLSTDASQGNCDTNAKTGMVCSWDWNISGIADNNYWITIEINDDTDSNTVTTEKSFRVVPVGCGQTITTNTTLTADLIECSADGITFGASNITLDCDGYSILGEYGSGNYGVKIPDRQNVIVKNCDINGFVDSCIYFTATSSDANIFDNNFSNSAYGVYLYNDSDRVKITNNNFYKNTVGLMVREVVDSNVSDNNFLDNDYGIYLSLGAVDNNFYNNIINSSIAGSEGISSDSATEVSSNNTFFDMNISAVTDVVLNTDTNVFLIDVIYSSSTLATATSVLFEGWWVDITIKDSSDQSAISSATVNIVDKHGNNYFSGTTNASGEITRQQLYDFNKTSIDTNYYSPYDINVSKAGFDANGMTLNIDENKTITIYLSQGNTVPDVNIWQVDDYDLNAVLPSFSYSSDKNLTMTFRTSDADDDDLNFNMWYDTSANGKTNKIIGDINLSTNTSQGSCDTNSKTGMVCSWDWNISGIADNNYWITIEINDDTDSNTITTEKSFRVNPPPSGNGANFACQTVNVGTGGFTSLDLNNSQLHIASSSGSNDINYCVGKYNSWDCEIVEEVGDAYTSLVWGGDGNVHIVSRESTGFDLRHCEGTYGNWFCEIAEDGSMPVSSVGLFSSIIWGTDNNAHIMHWDNGGTSLRYCEGDFGDWACEQIDTESGSDTYGGIVEFDGNMYVSQRDVNLLVCAGTFGNWSCVKPDNEFKYSGYSSSITSFDNNLHIIHAGSNGVGGATIRYCTGSDIAATWACENVDDFNYSSPVTKLDKQTSIVSGEDNNLHIAYWDGEHNDLKYCEGLMGNWVCASIDGNTGTAAGKYPSIDINNSSSSSVVHISHYNDSTGDLRYCISDSTAPIVTVNDSNNLWQNTDANLQFSCTDATSGCNKFFYSLDDVNYETSWGTDSNIGIVLTTDLNHEIFYISSDDADNNSATKLMFMAIDKTVPTSDHNAISSSTIWFVSDLNININCSDSLAGCKNFYYSIEGDANYQTSWGFDLNIGVSVTADGNTEIFFWSDDNTTGIGDNNQAATYLNIGLDETKPTIYIHNPFDGNQAVTLRTVEFDVNDSTSGIKQSSIQVDVNGVTSSYFNPNICTNFDGNYYCSYSEEVFQESNDYNVTIFVNDLALNPADQNAAIFKYIGDNNSPSIVAIYIEDYNANATLPSFSYYRDLNLTIDFNVLDADNDRLKIDIYYGATKLAFTYLIIEDLNLSSATCDDTDFNDLTPCSWDWDISGVSDGNYYINLRISDSIDEPTDSSDNNFMIDNTQPSLSNLNPLNDTTGSESNPQFAVTAGDALSDVSHCIAKKYVNSVLQETVNESDCATNISLSEGQDGYVSWAGVDNAGNTSSYFDTGKYTYSTGAGGTPDVGGGGGGGGGGESVPTPPHSVDVNKFCVADIDCMVDLICVVSKCIPLFGEAYEHDKKHFVVYPTDITPPATVSLLPDSRIILDTIFATNTGTQDMEINASFTCTQEQNCAKDWCKIIQGLSSPLLTPIGFKEIIVECTIPKDVNLNQYYYTQLVFATKNKVQKNVLITIFVGESTVGAAIGATQNIFFAFFDYGLVCFSEFKLDCFLRIPNAQPLGGFDSFNIALLLLAVSVILFLKFNKIHFIVLIGIMAAIWLATVIV